MLFGVCFIYAVQTTARKNFFSPHTVFMPSAYTHALIASETLRSLDPLLSEKLRRHLSLYFFGAQGADFCFFYTLPNGYASPRNLGSFLHRNGYGAFRVCKAFSHTDEAIFAYSLGYITHYAADTVFHPYVYATAGNFPLRHSRVEEAFDLFFKKQKDNDEYASFFLKLPDVKERNELFLLYASIAANARLPLLNKTAFLRSFTLFNAYLSRPFPSFDEKNQLLLSELTNAHHREWTHPQKPLLKSREGGEELFERSLQRSVSMIREFTKAVKEKTPLSFSSFGKNYLSGL